MTRKLRSTKEVPAGAAKLKRQRKPSAKLRAPSPPKPPAIRPPRKPANKGKLQPTSPAITEESAKSSTPQLSPLAIRPNPFAKAPKDTLTPKPHPLEYNGEIIINELTTVDTINGIMEDITIDHIAWQDIEKRVEGLVKEWGAEHPYLAINRSKWKARLANTRAQEVFRINNSEEWSVFIKSLALRGATIQPKNVAKIALEFGYKTDLPWPP